MSDSKAPAPAGKTGGLMKTAIGGLAGLMAGGIGMYATAIFNHVAKPPRPVANFAVAAEGLTVTCQNHANGQSGWWDFGDGSPLEPFASEQTTVSHTYAKPGSYAVKLIVRNFLMEENERAVPVDIATGSVATAGAPKSTDPAIPSFTVEPVGGVTTAPATFRVRGEVKNADRVIWDLGKESLEVGDAPGVFEKLVVFEKPGPYQLQLIGYAGRQAVKKAMQVNVVEARSGTLSAVVRVTDSGTQVLNQQNPQTLTIPLPAKGATTFERTIMARGSAMIAEVKLGPVKNAAVKSIRAEVLPDKRTAKVSGEWASGKDLSQAAGGTDVLVPLTLVEQSRRVLPKQTETLATQFTPEGSFILSDPARTVLSALIPLPPLPSHVPDNNRQMQFEIREIGVDRQMRVVGSLPDLKLPYKSAPFQVGGRLHILEIKQSGEQIRVTLTPVDSVGRV